MKPPASRTSVANPVRQVVFIRFGVLFLQDRGCLQSETLNLLRKRHAQSVVCSLKPKGLAIVYGLWETVGMAKAQIKTGQIVVLDGMIGVYRVVKVSPDGQTADIEKFDVSRQKSIGDPIRSVATN